MKSKKISGLLRFQELGIFVVVLIVCTIITVINPKFVSFDNLINVFRTTSYVVIVASVTTMVFIIGGLDLSVGSVMGIGGMICALGLLNFKLGVVPSILLGLLTGLAFGVFNGVLIVKVRIPALIVTLGTMYIGRGLMNVITMGKPIYPLPDDFAAIGSGTLLNIPYSIIFAVFVAAMVFLILKYTIFGRYVYVIGGNEETAKVSGINIDEYRIIVYAASGVFASITGIIMTARMASAQVSTGTGWEMTIISSVIIGGTSMFGGQGTVLGTVIGALLISSMNSGLVLMRVSAYWQNVVIGSIIILAVAIDQIKRRKSGDLD